jgi:recombinational DNA repair protein (RecF pathway)
MNTGYNDYNDTRLSPQEVRPIKFCSCAKCGADLYAFEDEVYRLSIGHVCEDCFQEFTEKLHVNWENFSPSDF